MRSDLLLSSACILGLFVLPSTAIAETGALTQLPGTDACVSIDGSGGDCADGVGPFTPVVVTVSPDGRNVYVTSDDAVLVFARDRKTGALSQLPGTDACVSEDGSGGDCADGVGLINPIWVAVSPDGRNVYVASALSSAVTVFARDRRTGALTQLPGTDACISEDGSGGDCADGVGLEGAVGVAVSPHGRNVYVTSVSLFDALNGAVAVFTRDRRTGALTQLPGTDACISEDGSGGDCADGVALNGVASAAVSGDGRNIYVTSFRSNAVAAFTRDRKTGALTQLPGTEGCVSEDGSGGDCADGVALFDPEVVTLSADGRNVYVASILSGAVAAFARDRRTGALTQLPGTDACISESGTGGSCAEGVALDGVVGVAVSPDSRNLYSASFRGVAAFTRDRRTGALTQLPGTDACISEDGSGGDCADGVGLDVPNRVAVSPDGRNVYVTSPSPGRAIAVFTRDRKGHPLAAR